VWSTGCNAAFEGVKKALTNAPVLALPDLNCLFEVICDACGVGLGAVVVQKGGPIAFEGKRMKEAEQKYTTGGQELLAVVHALQLWRCYLYGVELTVVTDHSPNTFFQTQAVLSPRQVRWAEKLSTFLFHWEYRAGRNTVADPLSWHPLVIAHMVLCALSNGADDGLMTDSDIVADYLAGYANDPWFLEEANIIQGGSAFGKRCILLGSCSCCAKHCCYQGWILQELHDSNYPGHVGIHRTIHMSSASIGGLTWGSTLGNMCRVVMCVNVTRGCRGSQLVS